MSDFDSGLPPGIAPGMTPEQVDLEMEVAALDASLGGPYSDEEMTRALQSLQKALGRRPYTDEELPEVIAGVREQMELERKGEQ